MAAIDRGIDFSIWSDDMRAALRRRARECGGIALITLAVIMAVALASWSVQDPSFSHATNAPVRNLLGAPGAIGSDLMMQLFGLASTVLVLPVAVWGWRIATHRPFDREWMRLAFWLIGTVLASGFAACLPKSATWPLPTGLGGVIGDALLWLPALLIGPRIGVTLWAFAAVLGVATLVAIATAAGFGWRERSSKIDERWAREAAGPADDDAERTSISLGWLWHSVLSVKARVVRLVMRRSPTHRTAPTLAVTNRDRIEPRLDRTAPVPTLAAEPD